jgi:hypothetical protein
MVHPSALKYFINCLVGCLLIFGGVACASLAAPTTSEPRMVEVTRVETRVVTSEVTRVLEVPITNTPLPTSTPSITPTPTKYRIPSATPTYTPPQIFILVDTACYYGPSTAYLLKYGLFTLNSMTVMGRNPDGDWLNIKSQNDPLWNACWIRTDQVKFNTGDIKNVPIVWMTYPWSILYEPPSAVSANRVGNEVTVFWQPVYMTEDDYRGYLIEAWVCQGGKQVFRVIGHVTSYAGNTDMMAEKVTDEPGCDVPSSARLYGVEKHGYTSYRQIPWPEFNSTETLTITPGLTPSP